MSQRSLVHDVAAPAGAPLVLTRTHGQNSARPVSGSGSGSDDDVLRPGGTVHEIPLPQRPLLALDDEQRFFAAEKILVRISDARVVAHRVERVEDAAAGVQGFLDVLRTRPEILKTRVPAA